jgi:NADPH:quinone reductase-like Zn-dependent oxidoreductase
MSGDVVAVGPDVIEFSIGDRVTRCGRMADRPRKPGPNCPATPMTDGCSSTASRGSASWSSHRPTSPTWRLRPCPARALRRGMRWWRPVSGPATSWSPRAPEVLFNSIRIVGVTVGSVRSFVELCELISREMIHPNVSHVLEWTDIDEAVRVLRAGEHIGKIALTIP